MLVRRQARLEKQVLADNFDNLPLEEKVDYIHSGTKFSEFEIQAYLYEHLRRSGLHVRGELKSKCGTCRFDLVVFDAENRPSLIIEVKADKPIGPTEDKKIERGIRKKQVARYRKFSIPVDLVEGMPEAVAYISGNTAVKSMNRNPPSSPVAASVASGEGKPDIPVDNLATGLSDVDKAAINRLGREV